MQTTRSFMRNLRFLLHNCYAGANSFVVSEAKSSLKSVIRIRSVISLALSLEQVSASTQLIAQVNFKVLFY